MKEHTPGPWRSQLRVLVNFRRKKHTIKDYYSISAGVGFWDSDNNSSGFEITGYMSEENARLIGAAPDLLEALELLLADYRDICEDKKNPNVIAALSAIAKAKGV